MLRLGSPPLRKRNIRNIRNRMPAHESVLPAIFVLFVALVALYSEGVLDTLATHRESLLGRTREAWHLSMRSTLGFIPYGLRREAKPLSLSGFPLMSPKAIQRCHYCRRAH
jgi:hypothetical protein